MSQTGPENTEPDEINNSMVGYEPARPDIISSDVATEMERFGLDPNNPSDRATWQSETVAQGDVLNHEPDYSQDYFFGDPSRQNS